MNSHSADPTLLLLLDEVRRKTLTRLEGLSEDQARFAPEGLQNSILWHAGHCFVVVEWLTMEALGGATTSPENWFDLFSWASRPAETPAGKWPPLDDVIHELQLQQGRMHKLFRNLTVEDFDNPARNQPNVTVRHRILHALHDEASHSGQIWLLRKLQGL